MKTKTRFNKLTAWVLTLAMLMTLVPSFMLTASAAESYLLWVGGVQFDENKLEITGTTGTATYDPATNTLTLNNYTYVGEGYVWSNEYYLDETYGAVIYYGGSDTLKLELIGESHITHQSDVFRFETYGIYSIGGIEVFGEDSLTADGGEIKTNEDDRKSDSYGVLCHGDLTVNSGSLTATGNKGVDCWGDIAVKGGSLTATGDQSFGVSCNKNLTVNGGSLTATTNRGNCVSCFGNLTVNGGSLTATTNRGYSVSCNKNITVNGGSLTAIAEGYSSVFCDDNIAFNGGEVLVKGGPVFTSGYNGFSCENGYYRNAENGVFSLWTENSSDERPPYFAFVGADHVTAAHEDGKHTISCKDTDCLLQLSNAETDCPVEYTYTADDNIITATCSANCGYSETATISATGKTYDGTAVEVTVTKTGTLENTDIPVVLTKDGAAFTGDPVNAGDYTASITFGDVTASADFTIAKKAVAATVTAENKTYDGNTTATISAAVTGADLVPGDSITITGLTGTFSDANAGENKTVTIDSSNVTVEGTNADCYEITYPATATATITKADSTVVEAPKAISGLKFKEENGNEVQQSLVTAGVAEGGTMVYRLSPDDEWSESIPVAGQARTHSVYYKVLGDSNHNDMEESAVAVTIAKADAPFVTIPIQEHFYTIPTTENRIDIKSLLPKLCAIIDGESEVTETTGDFIENAAFNNGVLSYDTNTGTLGAKGTITVKIVMRNYENVTVTVNVELIDLNPVSNSGADNTITYNGSTYDVAQMFTKDENAGEASYEIIGGSGIGELNGSVLEITKAGTIEIKMTTAANGNYAAGEASATLMVNKADGTGTVSMEGWTYGEEAKAPVTENGTGTAIFLYTGTGNGYSSTNVPTDAGTYTVTATFPENDLYKDTIATDTFVIAQKDITGATVGAFKQLTYTGDAQTPTAEVTVDGLKVTGTWSAVTNVEDKTTFTADGNFTGAIADKETGMLKADSNVATAPGANTLTYNEAAQELVTAGAANGGTLKYSFDKENWAETIPTGTDADNYEVWYKVFGDANHNDTDADKVDVTIAKKSIDSAIILTAPVKNTAPQTEITGDGYTATVTWSPEVTDKFGYNTEYTATITISVDENHTVTGIAANGYTVDGAKTVTNEENSNVITVAYEKTGSRPSSGGGGGSNTSTTTTKNEDGSTTKTTTNKSTGTVTEVTTNTDGSTTTVETKKDGTVTTTEKDKDGNTTTTVEKPDGTSTTTEKNKDGSEKVTEEKADGTTVTTEKDTDGTKTVTTENADSSKTTEETKKDGTKVTTETNADGETKTEIDLPKNEETEVTIPVQNAEDVTSITVTDKDGKETEITDFEITEDGVKISVSGDCTAVINKVAKKEFVDVHPVNHWATADIDYAYINGLMNGVSETHFAPNDNLTRAMLVTVLYRLEGEPATNRSIPFADVDMGAYYGNAVSWAKQNGIVNGVSETEFAPNSNITREQIAAIMYRYAQYKGYDVSVGENTNILSYDDFADISEYAIAAMQYACGSGLMKGKTESTLNPLDNATRAECAAILHRFIEANK